MMLTLEETLAREIGEREADGLASRGDHVRHELVRQRKINSDPARNGTTVRPCELEKLFEDTLGVMDICAGSDRRMTLSQRLGEGIEEPLRHRGKPEQNPQRVC